MSISDIFPQPLIIGIKDNDFNIILQLLEKILNYYKKKKCL